MQSRVLHASTSRPGRAAVFCRALSPAVRLSECATVWVCAPACCSSARQPRYQNSSSELLKFEVARPIVSTGRERREPARQKTVPSSKHFNREFRSGSVCTCKRRNCAFTAGACAIFCTLTQCLSVPQGCGTSMIDVQGLSMKSAFGATHTRWYVSGTYAVAASSIGHRRLLH